MKKLLIPIIVAAVIAAGALIVTRFILAPKPQTVSSYIQNSYSPEWYAVQAQLWEKQVRKHPHDDASWINWFKATRYNILLQASESHSNGFDYTPLHKITERLQKEYPGSFAGYFIEYMDKPDESNRDNMYKAIQMRPDFVDLYPEYVLYLIKRGDSNLLEDILKRWYQSGEYSKTLISYAYNEMAGMEPGGVMILNSESPFYSSLLVQYGMGAFKDKTIILYNLLYDPGYRESICNQLGIEDFAINTRQTLYEKPAHLSEIIAGQTGRPVYFSTFLSELFYHEEFFLNNVYSEGLVYRYSPVKYDNLSVKRRNFEQVYNLDYLYNTSDKDVYRQQAMFVNLNYVPCFSSLLKYYRAVGNTEQEQKLYKLLKHILDSNSGNLSNEQRKVFYNEINL